MPTSRSPHVLDGERRTWHRAAAADGPDPVLAADLEAFAADARHRSAYAAAAAALERAALLTTEPAERARRLAAAAECNWDAGRVERVEPLLDQALPLLGPEERASLGLLRGDLALERGRPAQAFELFVDAAGGLGRRDPAFALEMLARAAEATWWLGETEMATELHRVGAQVAPTDDAGAQLLLHLLRGAARVLEHDFEPAWPTCARACAWRASVGSRLGRRGGLRCRPRVRARGGSCVVRARRDAPADGGKAARAALRAQPAGHDGVLARQRAQGGHVRRGGAAAGRDAPARSAAPVTHR